MKFSDKLSKFKFSLRSHWPWPICLILLSFILNAGLVELPNLQNQDRELKNKINAQESALVQNEKSPKILSSQNLSAQLPDFERLSLITKDLHTLSEQNGLTISDAAFKPIGAVANTKINQMEIAVRLKGTYLPLKNILASLLANHDGLALEFISIQRSRATDLITDIEFRLSFYYRNQK